MAPNPATSRNLPLQWSRGEHDDELPSSSSSLRFASQPNYARADGTLAAARVSKARKAEDIRVRERTNVPAIFTQVRTLEWCRGCGE